MNKRFDYLDIAKGLGILFVVWAHIMLTGLSHQMIYAFHMPLFFLLSGMLFQRKKYNSFLQFVKKRAERLLVPYVLWSVVTWCVWALFRYVRHDEVASYWMPLLQTFIAQGSGEFIVHNSALWFIPCLFLVEILYFGISLLNVSLRLLICFGCAGLSFLLGSIFGSDYWFLLPWNVDAALIALPFYGVGNVLVSKCPHDRIMESAHTHWKWYVLILICLTMLLYWGATSYGECSMGSSSYNCNGFIFVIRAFVGCASLLCISLLLGTVRKPLILFSTFLRYIKWAGVNSLDIMCSHIPIKGVCMIIVAILLHVTVDEISNNLLLSFYSFVPTMIGVWVAVLLANWVRTIEIGKK